MVSRRWQFLLVLLVVLTLVGLSCADKKQVAPQPVGRKGGTLRVVQWFEPVVFNPFTDGRGAWEARALLEGLFVEDLSGGYKPASFVESWSVSSDGLTWTFKLKKGSKFHDGTPLNAEAVKWFYEEDAKGVNGYMFEKVKEIVALDEWTVEFRMKSPDPNLMFNLAQPDFSGIISPTAYKKYGADYGTKAVVGAGPFKFVEWVKGDHLIVERWDEYPGMPWLENKGPAYLDRIIFKYVPEDSTRALMIESEEVDAARDLPLSKVPEWEKRGWVVRQPGVTTWFVAFNCKKEPFTDLRVRQALAYAIDRANIAKNIFYGTASPAHTYLSHFFDGAEQVPDKYTFDLGKATQLLEEAGWKLGSDGKRSAAGKRLEFDLWCTNETLAKQVAEALQAQWAKVGVTAKVTSLDQATMIDRTKKEEHMANVWWHRWSNADILDWQFNPTYEAYPNQSRFDTPELRQLLADAMGATTWEDRVAKFRILHQYLLDNCPTAPIVYWDNVQVRKGYVKNWNFTYRFPYFQDVYLEKSK